MRTFTVIEEDGPRLKIVNGDGSNCETPIFIPKDFKGGARDPSLAEKELIALRSFNLTQSRSIAFHLFSKIGDGLIAFEVIHSLRLLMSRTAEKIEFIGLFANEKSLAFCEDFIRLVKIFDLISVRLEDVTSTLSPVTNLGTSPVELHCDYVAASNSWNFLWARWGIPGEFRPAANQWHLRSFARAAEERQREVRAALDFRGNNYVVFCTEAASYGVQKRWSLDSWIQLAERLLSEEDLRIIVISADSAVAAAFSQFKNVYIYNYKTAQFKCDLFTLATIIHFAQGLITLDTGPAHVAGFLGTPCISMFGPTAPVYAGHPRNMNLRLSSCPPCGAYAQRFLCQRNVCMEAFSAELICRAWHNLRLSSLSRLQ